MDAERKHTRMTFWDHVDRAGNCWLWTGAQSRGYGTVRRGGKMKKAHRVAFEMAHGPIPDGAVVRHTCDTPLCVRPDHLLCGTTADNNADRRQRREAAELAVLHGYGADVVQD